MSLYFPTGPVFSNGFQKGAEAETKKQKHETPSKRNWCASIVIPTYNEVLSLPELVNRICTVAPGVEILVVDEGSTDGTRSLGHELASRYPVRVIARNERGLSTAVLQGLNESAHDTCVVMNADLSHPPETIPSLLSAIESGYDVSIGSRYIPGGTIDGWPLSRRFTSRAARLFARPFCAVQDPMSGFFCLSRRLLRNVCMNPRGFKILLEILARTGTQSVLEIPIHFQDRAGRKNKFNRRDAWEFLCQIKRLLTDHRS